MDSQLTKERKLSHPMASNKAIIKVEKCLIEVKNEVLLWGKGDINMTIHHCAFWKTHIIEVIRPMKSKF